MKEIVYNKSTIPDVNYKIIEQIADTDITPQNCDKKHPVFEEHMEQIGKLYLNALNALDEAIRISTLDGAEMRTNHDVMCCKSV